MQYLNFEFASERELRETLKRLWEHYGVSGEVNIRPTTGERWRLDIISEKDLRDSTLEKLGHFRSDAPGASDAPGGTTEEE